MTEQTDAAEVEALAWALAIVQRMGNETNARAELPLWQDFAESLMDAPAFSDWLAAREAAARAEALREAADAWETDDTDPTPRMGSRADGWLRLRADRIARTDGAGS